MTSLLNHFYPAVVQVPALFGRFAVHLATLQVVPTVTLDFAGTGIEGGRLGDNAVFVHDLQVDGLGQRAEFTEAACVLLGAVSAIVHQICPHGVNIGPWARLHELASENSLPSRVVSLATNP